MRTLKIAIFILTLTSCHFNVKVTKTYELYFDESTYQTFNKAISAYQNQRSQLADSLFSVVIDKSKEKLSSTMPIEFNPYYYRGHNNIDLDKYDQAINDFEQVVSDTTTNTDILLARTEAFKMLKKYDTAIVLCDRLINLGFDSSIVLGQRGICYYQQGQKEKACSDLTLAKKLATSDVSYLDKFLTGCK